MYVVKIYTTEVTVLKLNSALIIVFVSGLCPYLMVEPTGNVPSLVFMH